MGLDAKEAFLFVPVVGMDPAPQPLSSSRFRVKKIIPLTFGQSVCKLGHQREGLTRGSAALSLLVLTVLQGLEGISRFLCCLKVLSFLIACI